MVIRRQRSCGFAIASALLSTTTFLAASVSANRRSRGGLLRGLRLSASSSSSLSSPGQEQEQRPASVVEPSTPSEQVNFLSFNEGSNHRDLFSRTRNIGETTTTDNTDSTATTRSDVQNATPSHDGGICVVELCSTKLNLQISDGDASCNDFSWYLWSNMHAAPYLTPHFPAINIFAQSASTATMDGTPGNECELTGWIDFVHEPTPLTECECAELSKQVDSTWRALMDGGSYIESAITSNATYNPYDSLELASSGVSWGTCPEPTCPDPPDLDAPSVSLTPSFSTW